MARRSVAREYHNGELCREWHRHHDGITSVTQAAARTSRSLRQLLGGAFLPEGYPDSVTRDYAGFQVWDSVQALCSYVRGMLTSQAMLVGIGLGKEAASPTAAVFNFLLRDMSGMLGGTIFAFFQGSGLDSYAKQWRLFADCFNNVGYVLELASPVFPSAFLLLACLGSIARAITGVAGGATRAALTQHFALRGNAADVAAKEGSQETATTLVGMLLGMAVLRCCSDSPAAVWAVFLLLTGLHIYANVQAMRSLQLASLNPARLAILVQHAFHQQKGSHALSPAQVGQLESLAPPFLKGNASLRTILGGEDRREVRLGVPLSNAIDSDECETLDTLDDADYLILLAHDAVEVVVRHGASEAALMQAFVQATVAAAMLNSNQDEELTAEHAEAWMQANFRDFQQGLAAARWRLDRTYIGPVKHTADWGHLHTA